MSLIAAFAVTSTLVPGASAQDEFRRYKTGQVHVGDHILASPTSNGTFDTCVVTGIRGTGGWRPGYDGDFLIACDHNGMTVASATGDHVHLNPQAQPPAPAATVTRAPVVAPSTVVRQPTPIASTPQPPIQPGGNAFGSRNPRACPSIISRPSNAQAAQLVACFRENESRRNLEFLADNVVVNSMTTSRYDPHTQTGFTNMDTGVAPIAIAGSLVGWQCTPQDGPAMMAKYSNVGRNCSRTTESRATGYCYKTRAGNWVCSMDDITTPYPQKDTQSGLPPPR